MTKTIRQGFLWSLALSGMYGLGYLSAVNGVPLLSLLGCAEVAVVAAAALWIEATLLDNGRSRLLETLRSRRLIPWWRRVGLVIGWGSVLLVVLGTGLLVALAGVPWWLGMIIYVAIAWGGVFWWTRRGPFRGK